MKNKPLRHFRKQFKRDLRNPKVWSKGLKNASNIVTLGSEGLMIAQPELGSAGMLAGVALKQTSNLLKK